MKKNFDFYDPVGFQSTVENKVNRMTFDPAFFADMIDFESGRYNTMSRRRSTRNSSSSSRSKDSSGTQNAQEDKNSQAQKSGNVREYIGESNIKPSYWVVW